MKIWLSLTNAEYIVVGGTKVDRPQYVPWHEFEDNTLEDMPTGVAKMWARKLRILAKDLEGLNG